jgi:ADP-glucose pyrophosphorylase
VVTRVKTEDRTRFGILEVDDGNRVFGFEEKTTHNQKPILLSWEFIFFV